MRKQLSTVDVIKPVVKPITIRGVVLCGAMLWCLTSNSLAQQVDRKLYEEDVFIDVNLTAHLIDQPDDIVASERDYAILQTLPDNAASQWLVNQNNESAIQSLSDTKQAAADQLAAEQAAAELAAQQQAEREAAALAAEQAELARQAAEQAAAELAAQQQAEREAAALAAQQAELARQAAEQAAAELAAQQQAEREAAALAAQQAELARQAAEQAAAELAAQQQAEREAAALAAQQAELARQATEQAAAELAAQQQAEREAAALAAQQAQAQQQATEQAARELAAQQQAEREAAELAVQQAAAQATAELAVKQSASQFIANWAQSWRSQNIQAYLASYVEGFAPATGISYSEWQFQRQQRLNNPQFINLEIIDLQIDSPEANAASARFTQRYQSDVYEDTVIKTLGLIHNGKRWLINSEVIE